MSEKSKPVGFIYASRQASLDQEELDKLVKDLKGIQKRIKVLQKRNKSKRK